MSIGRNWENEVKWSGEDTNKTQKMEDQVDEIKRKVDIVEVVGAYVSLKKMGRHQKGLCPFHAEKTPSFIVNEEMGMYKCFGCGAGGDVIKFLMEI